MIYEKIADEIISLLETETNNPAEASIILILVHVELWGKYGVPDTPLETVLDEYKTDFINLFNSLYRKNLNS